MKQDTSLNAKITVVCGSSGSGKSAWVKKEVKNAKRLIVWDVDDEYSELKGVKRFTCLNEMIKELVNSKVGKFCYVGSPNDFEKFCLAVFNWGVCVCVVEELAGVTSPSKAPMGWHTLVSRGRKRGITIVGVTQRPSESDKTIIGNASLTHVGRLNRAGDRKYMALEMDIPLKDVEALKPLDWIEKTADGKKNKGKLSF